MDTILVTLEVDNEFLSVDVDFGKKKLRNVLLKKKLSNRSHLLVTIHNWPNTGNLQIVHFQTWSQTSNRISQVFFAISLKWQTRLIESSLKAISTKEKGSLTFRKCHSKRIEPLNQFLSDVSDLDHLPSEQNWFKIFWLNPYIQELLL